jgi:hypothetical protein
LVELKLSPLESCNLLALVVSPITYYTSSPDDITEDILRSMQALKIKTVNKVKMPPVELGMDF